MSSTPPNDTLTWIGIAVAAAVGVGGWITAGIANSRAKKANKHSKDANTIATRAVTKAETANRIAEDANKLSKDANKLSKDANALVELSVSQQTEDWFVQWVPKWNEAAAILVLMQRGSHDAINPTVIVSGDQVHKVETFDRRVPKGNDLTVEVPQVIDQRTKHALQSERVNAELISVGSGYVPEAFTMELDVSVRWTTGNGFPVSKDFKLTVR